jgi:hypothetical protein
MFIHVQLLHINISSVGYRDEKQQYFGADRKCIMATGTIKHFDGMKL